MALPFHHGLALGHVAHRAAVAPAFQLQYVIVAICIHASVLGFVHRGFSSRILRLVGPATRSLLGRQRDCKERSVVQPDRPLDGK
jgi:hydrogenase/urease accessory protein HupE